MAKGTHGDEVQLCSAHQAMYPGRRLHLPEGKEALLFHLHKAPYEPMEALDLSICFLECPAWYLTGISNIA